MKYHSGKYAPIMTFLQHVAYGGGPRPPRAPPLEQYEGLLTPPRPPGQPPAVLAGPVHSPPLLVPPPLPPHACQQKEEVSLLQIHQCYLNLVDVNIVDLVLVLNVYLSI